MTPVPEYNATRIETEQRHPSPKADTEVKFGNRVIVVIESTEKSVDVSGGAGVLKKLYPYSVNGCRFEVLDKKLGASAVISSDSCISIQHAGLTHQH